MFSRGRKDSCRSGHHIREHNVLDVCIYIYIHIYIYIYVHTCIYTYILHKSSFGVGACFMCLWLLLLFVDICYAVMLLYACLRRPAQVVGAGGGKGGGAAGGAAGG